MTILVIDTETTGLTHLSFPNKNNLSKWPRLVQLAWLLVPDEGKQIEGGALIRPNDFIISNDSTKIHGITQRRALKSGEKIQRQLHLLNQTMRTSDVLVGHNIKFDREIIRSVELGTYEK